MLAAEQARRRSFSYSVSRHFRTDGAEFQQKLEASIVGLANEPDSQRAKLFGRGQQVAGWLHNNGPRETLAARAARAATADKRVAELEHELDLAREKLALQGNAIHSLQTSLDLVFSDILRLSSQLAETEAALADTTVACEATDQKLELLQNLLQVKERHIQELEQLRSKLIDDTNTLLKTCKRRDAALARAEERLSLLAELFVKLEAASVPNGRKTIETIDFQMRRELAKDKWLLGDTNTLHKKAV
jgi:chromosome segregation ATPase